MIGHVDTDSASDAPIPVGFKTVLRLRAHQKRERDDPVLLEPRPAGASGGGGAVVLHPPPDNLISPSSTLVRQIVSPDAVRATQDADYRFDGILLPAGGGPGADQGALYLAHGLPVALAAMEPLKGATEAAPRRNHLLVAMGAQGAGKTFTTWGGPPAPGARRNEADGLLPRILEGLFRQARHLGGAAGVGSGHKRKGPAFAVRMTLLQVSQNQTKPEKCQVIDLMQAPVPSTFSVSSAASAFSSLSRASRRSGTLSTSMISSTVSSPVVCSTKQSLASVEMLHSIDMHSTNDSGKTSDEMPSELKSMMSDDPLDNASVQLCHDEMQAREVLQITWRNRARHSKDRRYQSHVYVTIQPVLLDRATQQVLRTGGLIGVLDMASFENPSMRHSKQTSGNRGKETVIPSANSGYDALLHCLWTLQHNQEKVLAAHQQEPFDNNSKPAHHYDLGDDTCLMSSSQTSLNLKKVPHRQHKLTMLIQSLFSHSRVATFTTLFITAYTGHRDFAEKKVLFDKVMPFSGRVQLPVFTGLKSPYKTVETSQHKNGNANDKEKTKHEQRHLLLDRKHPDGSAPRHRAHIHTENIRNVPIAVAPGIQNASLGDSEDDLSCVPLPPPLAPTYIAPLSSPQPSAPVEECYIAPGLSLLSQSGSNSPLHGPHLYSDAAQLPDAITRSPPSSSYRFQPMKTLNGMVHASKKKGKQVMEKISSPIPLSMTFIENSLSKTTLSPEIEKHTLVESLQQKNECLQKENEALRAALLDSSNMQSDTLDSMQKYDQQESIRTSTDAENGLIDNDLLQFMSQLHKSHY